MALGFAPKTELTNNLSLGATSVSDIDDKIVNSSTSKSVDERSSDLSILGLGQRLARTFSQEDASTSSGEEDFSSKHSMTSSFIASHDSEASDDDKSLSPRSSASDVASCVYSVMFLLRMQAACAGRACASGQKQVLGYGTQPVPEDLRPTQVVEADRPMKSTRKAIKQASKRSSKSRQAAQVSEQQPRAALPESAADSWVAKQRARATIEDDDAKVIRSIRSILNKLTIEKFDSLFCQLVACGIRTPHHIAVLITELFEKATTQHQFIPMYAELCVKLARNSQIAHAAEGADNFRRLLLDQCQKVFEQVLEPPDAEDTSEEESQMMRKKRALGNMKLIGELLVNGMLSSSLLGECGNMLLDGRETCSEALECLAALLMAAGEAFDTKGWQGHDDLEAIFSKMDKLTADKATPPRVRFLLRDVLDVRSAGWRTSVNQTALKAAPMKLEEVREKALEEQAAASPKRSQGKPLDWEACRRASLGVSSPCSKNGGSIQSRPPRQKKSGVAESSTATAMKNLANVVAAKLARESGPDRPEEKNAHTNGSDSKKQAPPAATQQSVNQPSSQVNISAVVEGFNLVVFRRELAATLSNLAVDKNVPAAVQSIRCQEVPAEFQADQFVDILSRIVEERRGIIRRCEFAFAAGLMVSDQSPFAKTACLEGMRSFFQDVYAEMCCEVQRLPAIMRSEFVPTMRPVFSDSELNEVLPEDLRILV